MLGSLNSSQNPHSSAITFQINYTRKSNTRKGNASPFYRNVWEVAVQINKVNKIYWYLICFHQNARWVLVWQTKIISQQAFIVTIFFYNYDDLYFLIVLLPDLILVLILEIMVQISFRRFSKRVLGVWYFFQVSRKTWNDGSIYSVNTR